MDGGYLFWGTLRNLFLCYWLKCGGIWMDSIMNRHHTKKGGEEKAFML